MQRRTAMILLGLVIVSASLMYFLVKEGVIRRVPTQRAASSGVTATPPESLAPSPPPEACQKMRGTFETGIAFPQWGNGAYGETDKKWLTELPEIRTQTAACWVEIPVLFYQSSLTATDVTQGPGTPSLGAFTSGIKLARSLGFYVFVTPLIEVDGPQPWAGAIHFPTEAQERLWFEHYWQAIKPYVLAAAGAGVEQLSVGTELEWLQMNAPDALWNELIANVRSAFAGTLTYDMNWTSLDDDLPTWMHNPDLKTIGVSEYAPLIDAPTRVDPGQMPALWQQEEKPKLDALAATLGKAILISEIGYRNSADALYNSWEAGSHAPPDPQEQAGACQAALESLIGDPNILGTFFWGWDDAQLFTLIGQPAVAVIHAYYASLLADALDRQARP